MAVIGRIRQRSTLLIVVIGVALAAFILGDFFKRGGRQEANIGVIAGEKISVIDFNNRVERVVEMREKSSGERLNADDLFNIKQTTWNEYVQDLLMGSEYKALGLVVSKDELNDLIRGKDPHPYIKQNFSNPQTGEFNAQQVGMFLDNLNNPSIVSPDMRNNYLYLEGLIKKDRIQTKYFNLLSQGYYIPSAFSKADYEAKNKMVKYQFVAANYKSIPDSSVSLSQADYEKFYKENKYRYKQDKSRDIEYVVFNVRPTQEDRNELQRMINELYKEFQESQNIPNFVNAVSDQRYDSSWLKPSQLPVMMASKVKTATKGSYVAPYFANNAFHFAKIMNVMNRPDSMKATHILVSYKGAYGADTSVSRSREEAQRLADSLMKVAKRRPSQMGTLATNFSNDPSAKTNKGDLGWFKDGTMVPTFNNFVFTNKKGTIGVTETPFGFHVVRVDDKSKEEEKIRLAEVTRKLTPSDETYQAKFLEASDFATKNPDNASFNKAITEAGYNKRTSERLTPMVNKIPGLAYSRNVVQWAFLDKTNVGDVSQVFSFEDHYVVASLKATHDEEYQQLKDIKENIKPLVVREKKAEILLDKVNSALATTSNLEALAKALNTTVETVEDGSFSSPNIPGYGREPEVVGTIFSMTPGEKSNAIKGTQAIYVLQLDNVKEAGKKNDFSREATAMANQFRVRIRRDAPKAIEKANHIDDNRYLYY